MKNHFKQICQPMLLGLTILMIIFTTIYTGVNLKVDKGLIKGKNIVNFTDNWCYLDSDKNIVTFPLIMKRDEKRAHMIKNKIPNQLTEDVVLCVKTKDEIIQAYIDGKLVYEFGNDSKEIFEKEFGTVWNFIEISKEERGKDILLQLKNSREGVRAGIFNITLGTKDATILFLIKKSLITLFFCFFTFILGLGFVAFYLLLFLKPFKLNRKNFAYVGIFLMLVAVWSFTDTNLLQFISYRGYWSYLFSLISFMLLPIPFLMYIEEICETKHRELDILMLMFVILFFRNLYLYMFNTKELSSTLFLSHILIILAILCVLRICFEEKMKYKNKDLKQISWGIGILSITIIFSFFEYYIWNIGAYLHWFKLGVLIFAIILSIDIIKKTISILIDNAKAEVYKKIAYTDMMTELNNRAAFDDEMLVLEDKWDNYDFLTIIVFDINGLKTNNDIYGHTVGDQIIIGAAACIKYTFEALGNCYRIGGDEFVVILKNMSEEKVKDSLKNLQETILKYNKMHEDKISVSWGYAVQNKNRSAYENIRQVFKKADKNMYRQKFNKFNHR